MKSYRVGIVGLTGIADAGMQGCMGFRQDGRHVWADVHTDTDYRETITADRPAATAFPPDMTDAARWKSSSVS